MGRCGAGRGGAVENADPDDAGQERRATRRLVNYWLSIRRNHPMPAFVDFDPRRNPIGWDQCLLASCAGPDDVMLEHVGATLATIDRDSIPQTGGGPRPIGFVNEILVALRPAIESGTPQHRNGSCVLSGRRRLLFRAVLLPFRSLDEARRYVLGAASFRIDPGESDEVGRFEPDGEVTSSAARTTRIQ